MANINIYWIKKNFSPGFFNYWKQYIFYPLFDNNIWNIQKNKCIIYPYRKSLRKMLLMIIRFQKVNG